MTIANQSPLDWIKTVGFFIAVIVIGILIYKIYSALKTVKNFAGEAVSGVKTYVEDTYTAVSHRLDRTAEAIDESIGDTIISIIDKDWSKTDATKETPTWTVDPEVTEYQQHQEYPGLF